MRMLDDNIGKIVKIAGEIVKKVSFYSGRLPPFSQASFEHSINSTGHSRSFHTCEGMPIGVRRVNAYFQSGSKKSLEHLRMGPVLGSRSIKVSGDIAVRRRWFLTVKLSTKRRNRQRGTVRTWLTIPAIRNYLCWWRRKEKIIIFLLFPW